MRSADTSSLNGIKHAALVLLYLLVCCLPHAVVICIHMPKCCCANLNFVYSYVIVAVVIVIVVIDKMPNCY